MDGSGALPDQPVIRIVVPGPPRGWQRGGHKIITPKDKTKKAFVSTFTRDATRSEQGAIRMFAEQAMAGQAPFQGAVDLRYGAFFEIPRKLVCGEAAPCRGRHDPAHGAARLRQPHEAGRCAEGHRLAR